MSDQETINFNFRCPRKIAELIEQDCKMNGEFRNRSEWTMEAIRYFLDYRTKIIAERKKAFAAEEEDFVSHTSEESLQDNLKV